MKSALVIGLGRFGQHFALKFAELGNDVMVVDISENKVREILPQIPSAQVGDCTKEQVLRSIGVGNFDICVVAIGSHFQASLEITLQLKTLGAGHVISKAARDIHAKFLVRSGADEVIYPERQMAERIATRYSANHVYDYIELTSEHSVFEMAPMDSWCGKSIEQLAIRNKYHISILAIKTENEVISLPKPTHVITKGEHLIVYGNKVDMQRLARRL